jgi:hypothetical protein
LAAGIVDLSPGQNSDDSHDADSDSQNGDLDDRQAVPLT